MDTRELQRALRGRLGPFIRYEGIYTSDNLPYIVSSSKPVIFIANTLKSTSPISTVGHWVCFYIEFQPKKRLVFFDSFGLLPGLYSEGFSDYVEKKYSSFNVYDFGVQLQPDISQKCGLYVLYFIRYISYYGIDAFTSNFKSIFNPQI